MIDNHIVTLITEEITLVLYILKCAIYPYPELIGAGWSPMAATIFMAILYFTYSIGLFLLNEMCSIWMIKEGDYK